MRRTVSESIHTAEDRLAGNSNLEPPIKESDKKKHKKRGAFVHFGNAILSSMKPLVSWLPKPSSPGVSADAHDAVNLVFMLFAACISLDYIFMERTGVWQAITCTAYFVFDCLWILWDTDCVKQ